MPKIPGVNDGSFVTLPAPEVSQSEERNFTLIAGISAAVLLIVILGMWWLVSIRRPRPVSTPAEDANRRLPSSPQSYAEPTFPAPAKDGPTIAASSEDLSKPWAAKKFDFIKPITHEHVESIVIRLPGGTLWAFALQEPYGECTLEFVTDLSRLANQYGFRASHPMVVNPCHNTIYDPLKVGPAGGDVWVRGEIVHGIGLRPPTSIEVQAKGRSIIASRIE